MEYLSLRKSKCFRDAFLILYILKRDRTQYGTFLLKASEKENMSLPSLSEDTNRKVIIFSAEVFKLYNVLPTSEAQKQLFQPRGVVPIKQT